MTTLLSTKTVDNFVNKYARRW